MKRNDVLFALGILVVVAALYFLSVSGDKPPDIPPDMVHAQAGTVDECRACHSPEGVSPLADKHPPKEQCFACHELKTGRHGVMH